MPTKFRVLTDDEVEALQTLSEESWQEQLKLLVRGKIKGFVLEIEPKEVPGYGVLPEREFNMKVMDRTHTLFNAIRHRLQKASAAVDPTANWDEWVTLHRRNTIVRVFRVMDLATKQYKELPEPFVREVLRAQTRTARSLKGEDRIASERQLVGRDGAAQTG